MNDLEKGVVIAGKYKIAGVLATTELGLLFEARHIQLDDAVIVKVLSDGVYDARLAAKFVREARNAARVKNDHVARFMDVGTLPDGRPFVVMEYLDGEDVESMLKRGERVAVTDAVDWIIEACDALATAHRIGIVHRDLRPSSLYLARTGKPRRSVKVMNFGTSRVCDSLGTPEDAGLTVAGLVTGSPDYAAPEVILRSNPDVRADVWSLGAVLYELLTGVRPFEGEPDSVIKRIVADTPRPPRAIVPSIPAGLENVVLRCLEKKPVDRFATAEDLALALAPFASDVGAVLARQLSEPKRVTLSPRGLAVLDDEEDGRDPNEKANLHRLTADGRILTISPSAATPRRSAEPPPRRTSRRAGILSLAAIAVVALGAAAVLQARQRTQAQAQQGEARQAQTAAPPGATTAAAANAAAHDTPAEATANTAPAPVAPAVGPTVATASVPVPMVRHRSGAPNHPAAAAPPSTGGITPSSGTDDPWGWKR